MQPLQSLRSARFLARLVLAWFVLSLGAAIASPLVKPSTFHVVCVGGGHGAMKLVADGDTGHDGTASPLDCPLCAGPGAPPPAAIASVALPQPLGPAVQDIPVARVAALTAAPLPARGPPSLPFA